jgi:hypothetical protein
VHDKTVSHRAPRIANRAPCTVPGVFVIAGLTRNPLTNTPSAGYQALCGNWGIADRRFALSAMTAVHREPCTINISFLTLLYFRVYFFLIF